MIMRAYAGRQRYLSALLQTFAACRRQYFSTSDHTGAPIQHVYGPLCRNKPAECNPIANSPKVTLQAVLNFRFPAIPVNLMPAFPAANSNI